MFVACSENSGNEVISTTAVTDSKGTTHYYEPVTDDKGNISTTAENKGLFVEIETQSNGKAVTEKDGTYVTNEHITFLSIEGVTDNSSTTKLDSEKSSSDTTKNIEDADNVIEFKLNETTEETKPTSNIQGNPFQSYSVQLKDNKHLLLVVAHRQQCRYIQ